MSAALTLPLALAQRTIDHASGVALAAALLVLALALALALAKWNDDEDDEPRPGYVEIPPAKSHDYPMPPRSAHEWRVAAQESLARSRERRAER
jgi:hypothetical protein